MGVAHTVLVLSRFGSGRRRQPGSRLSPRVRAGKYHADRPMRDELDDAVRK